MIVLYLLCIIAFELAFAYTGVIKHYPWIVVVPLVIYGLAIILWKGKKRDES